MSPPVTQYRVVAVVLPKGCPTEAQFALSTWMGQAKARLECARAAEIYVAAATKKALAFTDCAILNPAAFAAIRFEVEDNEADQEPASATGSAA